MDNQFKPERPDPFLFPPETNFRLYALVAALFGSFAFIWSWLYLTQGCSTLSNDGE